MRYFHLLVFAVALVLSSVPTLAQTPDNNENTSKSLIRCHSVLFLLTVFGKTPITNEGEALIESIRSEIRRTTTESDIARLVKNIESENKKLMEEIASDNLSPSRAQEIMNEYSTSCKKVLSFAATLSAVR